VAQPLIYGPFYEAIFRVNRRVRARLPILIAAFFVAPVGAQMDLSGTWSIVATQAVADAPEVGEYVGLPLNRAALRRAETWDAAIDSLPIWQCRPQVGAASKQAASVLRITQVADPRSREPAALRLEWSGSGDAQVFLDGRGHPPSFANHTATGYSTGRWVDNALRIRTTHLKDGYYRANGAPQSDRVQLTEYVIRRRFRGQNYLSWVVIADDPIYLTEPLVVSSDYRYDPSGRVMPAPCSIVRPANGADSNVPSFMPGTNDQLGNFARSYDLPPRVIVDGAATMYPEYRRALAEWRARGQPTADGLSGDPR